MFSGSGRQQFLMQHEVDVSMDLAESEGHLLANGIALRASDIDLVFVRGYGFPRLKGGPMLAADQIGLTKVLAEVEAACATGGAG
jgi:3-hydroxyacyl-CoA dehydrogenase